MKKLRLYTVIVIVTFNFAKSVKLPSVLTKCDNSKPDFNECVIKNIYSALQTLRQQPLKSLKLPKAEPLDIPAFTIGAGSGPVGVEQNFQNAHLFGITGADILGVDFHLEEGHFYFNASAKFPEIKLVADYNLNGKVLLLPFYGEGNCTLSLKNLLVNVHFNVDVVQQQNKKYLHPSNLEIKVKAVERVYYNFENLYNGNKQLADVTNKVLNDNWEDIFNDVKSGYEDLLARIIENMVKNVFSRVSLSDLVDNSKL